MWQIMEDTIDVDALVLEGQAGAEPVRETELRLALRVGFLLQRPPTGGPSGAAVDLMDRGSLLRALLWRLSSTQQARLLFICYGPRAGELGLSTNHRPTPRTSVNQLSPACTVHRALGQDRPHRRNEMHGERR